MHTVKFNLFALRARLEEKSGRSYSWVEIADSVGAHRNTLQNLAANRTGTIDVAVTSRLLDFFASEGMPITIVDLFTVTTTQESQP